MGRSTGFADRQRRAKAKLELLAQAAIALYEAARRGEELTEARLALENAGIYYGQAAQTPPTHAHLAEPSPADREQWAADRYDLKKD